jgi:hypothetical protein
VISLPDMLWGHIWVSGHAGVRGNEIADRLARSSVQQSVGLEPFLEVSGQNIRKMKRWMEKQHLALWHGPCSTDKLES